MNLYSAFNTQMGIHPLNHKKMIIEAMKDAIDRNRMPKEYNEVSKCYVDIGYSFFEERDYEKSKLECMKLIRLIENYQKQNI